MLTDAEQISKTLVFPFRFYVASLEIANSGLSDAKIKKIRTALAKAFDLSMGKIPTFPGETLVLLDESGSMQGYVAGSSDVTVSKMGALFTAALIKRNPNADLMTFSTNARYRKIDREMSMMDIANSITFSGGGTNVYSAFEVATKGYNRIIVLSDMQTWAGDSYPYTRYVNKFGRPRIYSWDLANNSGGVAFPYRDVYCMAGYSDESFRTMLLLEEDKNALVNEIRKVVF